MRSLVNIIRIWYSELTDVEKDIGILIFVVAVPIFYPLLYACIYTNEVVRDVPVAVVDDCDGELSREFITKIDATPDVNIVAKCHDLDEAQEMLRSHKAYGIVRIPSSFAEDIYRGDQTTIGVYSDMSSMLYYKALLLAANNVSLDMNRNIKVSRYMPGTTNRQEEITKMPIKYDYVALYNPQSGFACFLIPPILMLILQQTMFLGVGMSMGRTRERNMGIGVRMVKWYKNPVYIVIGKSMVYFMIYLIMGVYMFTFVTRSFSIIQLGEFGTYLQFLVPYLLACVFMAITLSFFIYRREDCILLFVFMSLPLLFISGISWPGAAVPEFWRYVSYIFPSSFGLNGYVRISSMGASLNDVAFEYTSLWIQTGIYFVIACIMYRREILKMTIRQNSDIVRTVN